MSIWSKKRQQAIIIVIFMLITIPVSVFAYIYFNKPASCTDRKQNQNEQGIDCGGECSLYCIGSNRPPVVVWQRIFRVSRGLYTAGIYIQNPNITAAAYDVPYTIKVYDTDGVAIVERSSTVDIHPKYALPVIEPGIMVGERTPSRVEFEFDADPVWVREENQLLPIIIEGETILNEATSPRVQASLTNTTAKSINNVPVAVILYDADGNTLAVSKTIIESVPPNGSSRIVFTWPEPFGSIVARKEIIILR